MADLNIINKIFFNEIIDEAKNGEIDIKLPTGNESLVFNVGFNACVEGNLNSGNFGDSKPILMISSKGKLLPLLTKYVDIIDCENNYFKKLGVDLNERIKAYLSLIWSNAIYEDFANPYEFLKRRIDFFQNKLFDFDEKLFGSNIDFSNLIGDKNKTAIEYVNGSNINVKVTRQDIRMETPFLFTPYFEKNIDGILENYMLPSISYGISNDECYIYAIQDKRKNAPSSYEKKLSRIFYGLNKDIEDENVNLESLVEKINEDGDLYIEGEDENIGGVSPSSIISLTIFLSLLKSYGIDKVKVISLLPLRYNSKEDAFNKKYKYELSKKDLTKKESEKLLLEYKREHLRIQKNLSEKFIRNFRRLEYHFNSCFISSYPMEFDEYLHFCFSEFENSNNLLLNDILEVSAKEKNGCKK